MPNLSGNALKRLGKRLRDGERESEDIEMLEQYRRSFDRLLLKTAFAVDASLRESGIAYFMAGRSKRTKSILRKLERPQNRGMDLSRMCDIVGLRVITQDIETQDTVSPSAR